MILFAAAAYPVPGALTITSGPTLPSGTVGVPYSVQLTATGGCAPNDYTWSVGDAQQPLYNWIYVSPGGVVSGTPVTPALGIQYTFTVTASDDCASGSATLTIPLGSGTPTIQITGNPPAGEVNQSYSYQFSATGATGISWSLQGAPAWLAISSSTGVVSGTPTASGPVSFTVVATAGQASANLPVNITVYPALVVQSSTLPAGLVNTPYSQQLVFSGGSSESYTASATGLPPGLSVANSGRLSGTPTTAGAFNFSVSIRDSAGFSSSGSFALTIVPALSITSTSLAPATVGGAYSQSLSASGGSGGYSWSASGLPPGLSINAGGQITGTPTAAGSFPVGFTVRDSSQNAASATLTLTVTSTSGLSITSTSLPAATVGVAYSQTLAASGGSGGYSWSASGLPPGLSINAGGQITGTPTAAGSFPVGFTVRDSSQNTASATLTLTVTVPGGLSITSTSLPPATVGTTYSDSLAASGGSGGYNWSASGLPAGLTMSTGGQITGTPTTGGSFSVSVTVKDSSQNTATATLTLTVAGGLSITSTSLPSATVGVAYSQTLSAAGGSGRGYSWSASGLPQGLSLSTAGQITGTPAAPGSFPVTVTVKDSAQTTATATLTLQVNTSLQITTTSLANGVIGQAYSASLSASGAVGNVTWSLTGGALPAGLSLASNGTIAGTPAATGDFTFTIQAVDSTNQPVSARFSIHVALPAPSTLTASLPPALAPGSQPAVTIDVSPAYPLPLNVTAILSISPDLNGATDLGFTNGSRTIQFTIPANTTEYKLPFSAGTSAGTITVTLNVDTTGQAIIISGALVLTGQVSPQAPSIANVTATISGSTLTVVVTGFSSTRDMKNATFHFTAAAGATLGATDFTLDVSSVFTTWYANPASFPTGSQFKLTVPFTIGGNPATIASVTVTLTNSNATSSPATASVH